MQYPTSLRLFILLRINFVHIKFSYRFEIDFWSKWPIWNPYWFWVSFHLNSRAHKKRSWVNIEVTFLIKIKSYTGLGSFYVSCEHTLSFPFKNSLSLAELINHPLWKSEFYSNYKYKLRPPEHKRKSMLLNHQLKLPVRNKETELYGNTFYLFSITP